MPFRPLEKWYAALANRESRHPVFILSIDGAPAVWTSGPVRARVPYSLGDRLSGPGSSGIRQTSALVGTSYGRTFVASAWIKAGSLSRCKLQITDAYTSEVLGQSTLNTDLTGEWVRYVVWMTGNVGGFGPSIFVEIANQGGDTGTIFVWGMQLEERTGRSIVATGYERTDTVLYLKNLLYASEDTDDAHWTKINGCTSTADQTPAPDSIFNTAEAPMVVGALDVQEFTGNQVYPSEGRYNVGELKAALLNDGDLVARWLGTEREGAARQYMARAALYAGEAELSEDEYQVVWSGFTDKTETKDGGASYELRGLTKLDAWGRQVMTNCDSVSGSVSVPVVESATSALTMFRGNSDLSQVDDFYNGWTLKFTSGKNENAQRTVLDYVGATRTFTLTTALPNASSDKDPFTVFNFVRIVGNPIDIYARILLGDFALTGQVQTDFPLAEVSGVTPTGLAFGREELDIEQLQNERDVWYGGSYLPASNLFGQALSIDWIEPEEAKKFFEGQIFRVIDAYPTLSADGLFRVRAGRPNVPSASGTLEVSDANIEGAPKWTRLTDQIVTQVKVWGDFNLATKSYQLLADHETRDPRYTSAALGRSNVIEIKSRGLRSSLNGAGLAAARADRLLSRFGTGGPEQITVATGPALAFLESGERVSVTLRNLPVLLTGSVGKLEESFEVVRVRMKGSLVADLTLVGFYPLGNPSFIGPDTMAADYASATAADKVYAYVSPQSGYFADARPPYVSV